MPTVIAILFLFFANVIALIAFLVAVFKREKVQRKFDDTVAYLASKEEFNALVVHELRTPLSLISGSTDTILRHKDLKREVLEDLVTSIKTSSDSMLELVSAILDLAKMEAGRFGVTKEKSDLVKLIDEVVDAFVPLSESKKLKIIFEKKELPPIPMDPFRIRQVLNNLLSNAIKYADKGEIKIYTHIQDDKVTVCVQDQGRGISEEELPSLFARYNRLSSSKGSIGSGLGLVVVKGIVEAHGGHIWVDSKLGIGSTFCFSLPLSP